MADTNLSVALRAALDNHPDEAQHVRQEVEALAGQLDARRRSSEAVLEDSLRKTDNLPIDRSVSPEMAYLQKVSPSGAAALEANTASS